jgi:hypothetical protein
MSPLPSDPTLTSYADIAKECLLPVVMAPLASRKERIRIPNCKE